MMHYPRCGTCRRVLEFLDSHSNCHRVVHFVSRPPSEAEWREVCVKLQLSPKELLRQDSPIIQSRWADTSITDEEWLGILVRYPQLARRPIVMHDNWALIPDDPDDLRPFFEAT